MKKQTRWLCGDCLREWLNARTIDYNIKPEPQGVPWEEATGCPFCGSHAIQLVTYTPVDFPGGDIPRGDLPRAPVINLEPLVAPPPVTVVREQRNTTLAASSPEFS